MVALLSAGRLFSDTAEGNGANGTKVSVKQTRRDWFWVVRQLQFVE